MQQFILFPIPLSVHIIFAVISIIILTVSFIRRKYIYKIVLAEDIACTFLIYICKTHAFFTAIGFIEFILLGICFALRYLEAAHPKLFKDKYQGLHYKT